MALGDGTNELKFRDPVRATGLIPPGGTSAPIKLSTPGTMGYHCAIHPSMVGSVNVTP